MQMINVLQRLAELDSKNPRVERPMVMETPIIGNGIKQLDVNMPEPDITALRQLSGLMESREFGNSIAECGMPGMGAAMPMTPASLSMTAGNANEIVTMMRGLADIASGASSAGMPGMGAPMPSSGGMLGDMPAPMDLDHDGEMDGTAMPMGDEPMDGMGPPDIGGDELGGGPMGGDELADMVNKLKTGQPVKISTNMPVKVKTSNPVNGGEKDEGIMNAFGLGKKPPATTAQKNAEFHAANKGQNMPSSGNTSDDQDYFTGRDKTLGGGAREENMAEEMRVWDTSPKEHTRDYNPNDFAQMFNKIKDLDVAKAATRADNPLKRESVEQAPVDTLSELTNQLFADYQAFVNEGRAKEGNAFGKAVRDAKKDGVQSGEKIKVGGKSYSVKESDKQTMSRAAKGNEKYGKAGMQALAKAGREGRSLEPVKAKYNKYD
jgi:hypothetical protein